MGISLNTFRGTNIYTYTSESTTTKWESVRGGWGRRKREREMSCRNMLIFELNCFGMLYFWCELNVTWQKALSSQKHHGIFSDETALTCSVCFGLLLLCRLCNIILDPLHPSISPSIHFLCWLSIVCYDVWISADYRQKMGVYLDRSPINRRTNTHAGSHSHSITFMPSADIE